MADRALSSSRVLRERSNSDVMGWFGFGAHTLNWVRALSSFGSLIRLRIQGPVKGVGSVVLTDESVVKLTRVLVQFFEVTLGTVASFGVEPFEPGRTTFTAGLSQNPPGDSPESSDHSSSSP